MPLYPSLYLHSQATTDLLSITASFLFGEFYINGTINYVLFFWQASFTHMVTVKSFHAVCVHSSFLFSTEHYSIM